MTAIFLTTAKFPVVSVVGEDAAGSGEQGGDAYQTKDEFHIFFHFVISSEGFSPGAIDSL
jgi:hypothetical protein